MRRSRIREAARPTRPRSPRRATLELRSRPACERPDADAPRLTVALTFDHDAISDSVRRGDPPVKLSHGEFGPRVGVPRILELLAAQSIPSTWFVPGHTLVTFPESVRRDRRRRPRARPATAGITRTSPTLEPDGAGRDPRRCVEAVAARTGAPPRGFRAPYWSLGAGDARAGRGGRVRLRLVAHGRRLPPRPGPPRRSPLGRRRHDLGRAGPAGRGAGLLGARRLAAVRARRRAATGWPRRRGSSRSGSASCATPTPHAPGGLLTVTMHPECIGRGHRMAMLETFIAEAARPRRRRLRAPRRRRQPLVGREPLTTAIAPFEDRVEHRRASGVPVNVFCWLGW